MNETVLIVEDDNDIAELMSYHLKREGYTCRIAGDGDIAWQELTREAPDLVLLDLMLPGMDGLTICRRMRGSTKLQTIPVIMVTAKGDEKDIITGLELGADDYIVKPFNAQVLLARIHSVMRRTTGNKPERQGTLSIHNIELDEERHVVKVNGELTKLTTTEFNILSSLMRKSGRVFTRYQIVDATRGSDTMVTDRSVDVHIASLRKKLKDSGSAVETVHGIGYRFKESE